MLLILLTDAECTIRHRFMAVSDMSGRRVIQWTAAIRSSYPLSGPVDASGA